MVSVYLLMGLTFRGISTLPCKEIANKNLRKNKVLLFFAMQEAKFGLCFVSSNIILGADETGWMLQWGGSPAFLF